MLFHLLFSSSEIVCAGGGKIRWQCKGGEEGRREKARKMGAPRRQRSRAKALIIGKRTRLAASRTARVACEGSGRREAGRQADNEAGDPGRLKAAGRKTTALLSRGNRKQSAAA